MFRNILRPPSSGWRKRSAVRWEGNAEIGVSVCLNSQVPRTSNELVTLIFLKTSRMSNEGIKHNKI